jgi:hypothetical protein
MRQIMALGSVVPDQVEMEATGVGFVAWSEVEGWGSKLGACAMD